MSHHSTFRSRNTCAPPPLASTLQLRQRSLQIQTPPRVLSEGVLSIAHRPAPRVWGPAEGVAEGSLGRWAGYGTHVELRGGAGGWRTCEVGWEVGCEEECASAGVSVFRRRGDGYYVVLQNKSVVNTQVDYGSEVCIYLPRRHLFL